MAAVGNSVRIGDRPLHVAVGAGHRNAEGGDPREAELNGRVCAAVVALARRSTGFEVRSYTPRDGLGIHPGPVDEGPRHVATTWDRQWTVDVFHEIHAQAVPTRPAERGVFVIYPDGAGLTSTAPSVDDCDEDVRAHGSVLAHILAAATELPVGGAGNTGVLSEQDTEVGRAGRRLRVFAATATPRLRGHSCRFISEVGSRTNERDWAIMVRPAFAGWQAVGILRAYASLAAVRMGWTYPYRIAEQAPEP